MESSRFDTLTRVFARPASRRRTLAGVVAAALAPLTTAAKPEPAKCLAVGKRCSEQASDAAHGHGKGKHGGKGGKGKHHPPPCAKCCSRFGAAGADGKARCACKPEGEACDNQAQCCGGLCRNGKCTGCPNELTACDGACVDLQTNDDHCGDCATQCAAGQRCVGGTCVCDATSCPRGCCDADGACQRGTSDQACGIGGADCRQCGSCSACDGTQCAATDGACCDGGNGVCQGETCAACGDGQRCQRGQCVCDDRSCGGCCDGSACVPIARQSDGQCGDGGNVCQACASGQRCNGGRCLCDATGCPGGCCDGDACVALGTDANCARCGDACPDGAHCVNGHCTLEVVFTTVGSALLAAPFAGTMHVEALGAPGGRGGDGGSVAGGAGGDGGRGGKVVTDIQVAKGDGFAVHVGQAGLRGNDAGVGGTGGAGAPGPGLYGGTAGTRGGDGSGGGGGGGSPIGSGGDGGAGGSGQGVMSAPQNGLNGANGVPGAGSRGGALGLGGAGGGGFGPISGSTKVTAGGNSGDAGKVTVTFTAS